MPENPKNPLKSPDLYLNRELSWLEFNHRVLQEGLDAELPLLERLKFLAIVNSNLDEFFLVRVAWLMRGRAANVRRRDLSGMTPAEQLAAVSRRVHQMVDRQAAGVARGAGAPGRARPARLAAGRNGPPSNGSSSSPISAAKFCRS